MLISGKPLPYQIFNLDRLEKIRRGAYGLTDEYSDNSTTNNDIFSGSAEIQYQHDSAESSVEGKTGTPIRVRIGAWSNILT